MLYQVKCSKVTSEIIYSDAGLILAKFNSNLDCISTELDHNKLILLNNTIIEWIITVIKEKLPYLIKFKTRSMTVVSQGEFSFEDSQSYLTDHDLIMEVINYMI